MSFSDVGTEWYARPTSIINGRDDLIKSSGRVRDDPFADDGTPVWLRCALSHSPLLGPVVCDIRGNLFLKEDLLLALLKKRLPLHLSHVGSLKDVFNCNFRRLDGMLLCPVTGDDLAKGRWARVLRPCGCVISQAAAELSDEVRFCEVCSHKVEDFVPCFLKFPHRDEDKPTEAAKDRPKKSRGSVSTHVMSQPWVVPDAEYGEFRASALIWSDYYKLLGVDPASSAKDIGKAFRQLARKVHPDKLPQGSSEAEQLRAKQRFQQVAKAWEVLGDPEKRAHYDAERAAAQEVPQRPRPARGQPGAPVPPQADTKEEEERRFREELRRAKQQEKKKEREAEESRKERERDKTGGLGGHWVPPSSHFEPKGPERSGGLHHWSGWSAARNEDVHSDTSSVLSFDLRVDLNDLDLRFAEKISADDELDEVWEMRKVKTPTPETSSPVSPLRASNRDDPAAVRRHLPRCRCAVQ
ncbi:unnamed protein product [Durusdinium trenchii]|uniref:J domain-containing protein n=1 Tax=Durusdinium trenchii TaxID=1381693 RepID=A0ABP0NWM4_9DINO